MAKPKIINLIGRGGRLSLDDFWSQSRITDETIAGRFVQLFGNRGDGGVNDRLAISAASESAARAAPAIVVSRGGDSRAATGSSAQMVEIANLAGGWTVTLPLTAADVDPVADDDSVPTRPSVPPAPESENGPEAGDDRMFAIPGRVDPLIAAGLVPFMASIETREKAAAPGGWLENHLIHNTQPVLFVVEFGAAGYADAAVNPSPWGDLGTIWGQLDLSGDFSAGFTLTSLSFAVTYLTVAAGNDYNLAAADDFVAAGDTLTIDATGLGEDGSILFDGSAETDGRFVFMGGDSDDSFLGGSGDDWIWGAGGADDLSGGDGADRFIYREAADSSSVHYDTIGDFDPTVDRIDLNVSVSGFASPVAGGTLSMDSFDADLGAALAGLGANRAAWFAPDAGDLAGTIFLVIDANGIAGYQAGEDYVIAIGGSPLEDLTGHTGFFI